MNRAAACQLTLLYLSCIGVIADPGDWPSWRGPTGDGKTADTMVPLEWSETKNVLWKTTVPGRGHSSPIVVGSKVFLTTADETGKTQSVLCLDRRNGQTLWSTVVHRGGFMPKHRENSHATPTPACDGRKIYTVFMNSGSLHVTALNFEGDIVWTSHRGPFDLSPDNEGYASSPVIFGSLVIINGDNRKQGFLAAFERSNGKLAWRQPRRSAGSFATPIVARLAGRDQLLLCGSKTVDSYDPATGERIWSCRGSAEATANTVAFDGDYVIASGGAPEQDMVCVKADGTGDVSNTHVRWRTSRGITYVPSPLCHQGRLYVINSGGIAQCIETTTGKLLWSERLGGAFKASPVLAGERIYISDEKGGTYVFKASDRFELMKVNKLDQGCYASPAIADNELFLRTYNHLYCLTAETNKDKRP